jgi:transcriptional regulator with XRE-family HTH domain
MRNRIREHRELRGLTQEELAAQMETSPQQISRLERSERRLSDVWLEKLSRVLTVNQADFFVDDGTIPRLPPRKSDLPKDEIERRLIAFWQTLSPQAQTFILDSIDRWADLMLRGPTDE